MTQNLNEQMIWDALQDVKDPEIPTVSVVEMGMVNRVTVHGEDVEVEMTPTFTGCPALDIIRENVRERIAREKGVRNVQVRFVMDPPWTSDRITPDGRLKLREFGIAAPPASPLDVPPCPFCGAEGGDVDNLFGPTACRAIYYCRKCKQPYEGMKKV
ncbi:1,2-phenylacetyl-CoA epoxidase subunit PaaD [Staphylospora marina]|uniref:1,2-phenylacetyl-CoA epoxidase subunit PaaD n=1 Tax=Staphylospora marina TaxID=2490858 RepID=UPI000F5BE852|nr:1,2-phenylacetyl-CoA epoxidase subunit PaaD [Staphylospora marina]